MRLEYWKDKKPPARQRKMEKLIQRFNGDKFRMFEYVSKRKLDEKEKDWLGREIVSGGHLHLDRDDYLRLYPRICSHIICESLGYATPTVAAMILKDRMETGRNNCEWIYSCYGGDAKIPVRHAIENRRSHHGYMADYRHARALVQAVIDGKGEPVLASWF